MRLTHFRRAGLALCVVLGLMAGASRLMAQDGAPRQARNRGGRGGMFLMGAGHAQGTVTAVSGTTITIKDEQGQTYRVETGPNTHIRKNREEAKLSDLHPGDVIVAVGNLDAKTNTLGAMFVVVLNAEQAARMEKMRADFGKTWTAGLVTAKKGLMLTIERPDKVSQTITVNENTEFRKRGPDGEEDIAFPDIRVGDRVMARGALEHGSFVASTVGVMGPRPHGGSPFGGGMPAQPPASPGGSSQPPSQH